MSLLASGLQSFPEQVPEDSDLPHLDIEFLIPATPGDMASEPVARSRSHRTLRKLLFNVLLKRKSVCF